jgi:hypothetical protein
MNIRELLKKLNGSRLPEFNGHNYFIQIFSDGSGSITDNEDNEICVFLSFNDMSEKLNSLQIKVETTKTNWEI